jgi:hypothetical protein
MYARYNWLSSATQEQILADVIKILTGTTLTSSLSAGADTTNSFINSTYYTAGWSMFDQTAKTNGAATISNATPAVVTKAAHGLYAGCPVSFTTTGSLPTELAVNTTYFVSSAGFTTGAFQVAATYANAIAGTSSIATSSAGSGTHTLYDGRIQILSAPVFDGGGVGYNYASIDVVTTANQFTLTAYETWNATTHAGTNQLNATAGSQAKFTVGSTGNIALYSNSNCLILYGNNIICSGLFARNRTSPWDTVAAGYPNMSNHQLQLTSNATAPRTITAAAGWAVTAQSALIDGTTKIQDGAGGLYAPLSDLVLVNFANQLLPCSISALTDVWGGLTYPNTYDQLVANGKTYVFLVNGMSSICVPFG